MGDADRGSIATNAVVHTLQTHEDKGATTPTEIVCSKIWSCACREGMSAGAGGSVFSWRGPPAASSTKVTVHGRPRATGQPPPHPGAGQRSHLGNYWLQRGGPIDEHSDRQTAATTIRQPHHHGKPTATDHTRTSYRHNRPTKTSTPSLAAARQAQQRTSRPYGD